MGGGTFLIGGGWDAPEVYGPLLRASGGGRIGCVIVDEGDGEEQFARYAEALRSAGAGAGTAVPLLVPLGKRFEPGPLVGGLGGLLVCGGLTPAYQDAFAECAGRLTGRLAERGIPYAGFSAGAVLAARRAVVGGWLADGVPVCPPDTAEDLEEVEVRPGLGLVPFSVDVHAAQWGTLGRLVAAVSQGSVPYGVAIDENTVLEVTGATGRVGGRGRVHVVRPSGAAAGAAVRSYAPGESVPLGQPPLP
ncbi:hypothetical protein [Streptomyces sp. GbtcB6]|uniref:hypothetical protein n=1 Tax=Streptomyces sp. GbtcB6 TaxID=2824751 RepID=UPI001C3050AD|nr:hypothetical protein [Streptomyces sp. GbtcB6]